MRSKLQAAAESGKAIRIHTRIDRDTCFVGTVLRVGLETFDIELWNADDLSIWGESTFLIGDIYRIDTYTRDLAEAILERAFRGEATVLTKRDDDQEGREHATRP